LPSRVKRRLDDFGLDRLTCLTERHLRPSIRKPLRIREKDGARCKARTCDPYRVKVVLYH
jgi:hypothetical protein